MPRVDRCRRSAGQVGLLAAQLEPFLTPVLGVGGSSVRLAVGGLDFLAVERLGAGVPKNGLWVVFMPSLVTPAPNLAWGPVAAGIVVARRRVGGRAERSPCGGWSGCRGCGCGGVVGLGRPGWVVGRATHLAGCAQHGAVGWVAERGVRGRAGWLALRWVGGHPPCACLILHFEEHGGEGVVTRPMRPGPTVIFCRRRAGWACRVSRLVGPRSWRPDLPRTVSVVGASIGHDESPEADNTHLCGGSHAANSACGDGFDLR